MSAYIESPAHIDTIVSYFIDPRPHQGLWLEFSEGYNYMSKDNAADIAAELYAENVKSVDHRYNETNIQDYEFTYIRQARDEYTPAEIAKALDGYEYQSCETPNYYNSRAASIVNSMRKHLLSNLAGYEEADTWSIDTVRPATRQYISVMDMAG